MAKNNVYTEGRRLKVVVTHPTTPTSGSPCIVGQMPAVALGDKNATTNETVVATSGVFTLSVKAVDSGGNSAVSVGDIIYYVSADTPPLSKKNTGVRFGYALDSVASGQTGSIPVKVGY